MKSSTSRNHAMDFLRCCAVLFVVTSHAELAHAGPSGRRYFGMGGTGVDLFFVLSGYLLGHQLFNELRQTGRIDVGRFWIRRWMRTLPAYYAMLGLTTLWLVARHKASLISPTYLVFLQNYLTDLPYYAVTWSLCVEEHFYLAIAPALWLCARSRWAGWLVAAVFLVGPFACRSLGWYGTLDETHVRWDGCAMGVLIAWLKVRFPNSGALLAKLAPPLAVIGLLAFVEAYLARIDPTTFVSFHDSIGWSLIYASWVLLANSSRFWSERFRVVGARYLAERSYSVYLLHPEILALSKRVPPLPFPVHLAATIGLSLALAEVLFQLVERPITESRERFQLSRSRVRQEEGAR